MLGYVAKVHIYLLKHLIFSFKARRGLQKQNFSWQNTARSPTLRSVCLCGVDFLRKSRRKRIFKQNHLSLFIRGPDCLIHEITNAKYRVTLPL